MPWETENQQMVSPSQQCSSTPVSFGQWFLNREQCDNNGASPTLSWPGSIWFLLFPQLKSAMKARRFWNANDIKNVTKELKRLAQNGCQVCSQKTLQSLAKVYIYTRGLFWRRCSLNNCAFLYFSEIRWFQEHFVATTYVLLNYSYNK